VGVSRIHVTIDRLVLAGMEPAARAAFVRGLKAQLAAQLADPAARTQWARPQATPVLRLGRVAMEPGLSGAQKLGGQVAHGIGKGLKL
jgi:hypothetical protein